MKHSLKNDCVNNNQKRTFLNCIAGKIIKKYKCTNIVRRTLSSKIFNQPKPVAKSTLEILKNRVKVFLEDDSNSTLCPGKNDTVTRKKVKKQKRYLNENLKKLHKLFCNKNPECTVSYATFCRLRPFWIVQRKVFERDTCLCLVHENIKFMVSTLYKKKIIRYSNSKDMLHGLCCISNDKLLSKCLERECLTCKDKKPEFLEYCGQDTVSYNKWTIKKENLIIRGQPKACTKYVRELVSSSVDELIGVFSNQLPLFMTHVANIIHQHTQFKKKKEELKQNEVLIHMDFSENYECKFADEIQAFHFGGSREQVSIHTVMLYFKNNMSNETETKAFCMLSSCLDHDAAAICVHLRPVLEHTLNMLSNLKTVHFVSDGPSTQCRNRKMFFLLATYISQVLPLVNQMTWNYSEAGHGKGAPDGLGGTIKRTADTLVSQGKDIQSFKDLITNLQNNDLNIEIIPVQREDIERFKNAVSTEESITFKGTMKVHQVVWLRDAANLLFFRRLSCFSCLRECSHFDLGKQNVTSVEKLHAPGNSGYAEKSLRYADVYSDDSEEENHSKENANENTNYTPSLPNPEESIIHKFVVVKFSGKKVLHHFVGMIEEEIKEKDKIVYNVRFLRKTNDSSFSFPVQNDQSYVELVDIVQVLNDPTPTRRQTYIFNDLNVKYFSNLK